MTINLNADLKNRLQERAATFGGDAQTLANLFASASGLMLKSGTPRVGALPSVLCQRLPQMTSRFLALLPLVALCATAPGRAAPPPSDARLPVPTSAPAVKQAERGYFRFPALHDDKLVFTAEGDLWQVSVSGGVAERLTTHPAVEDSAAFSPDGNWIAFSAQYEGPRDVYVMPSGGGSPQRLTWGTNAGVVGWTPDSKVLYRTAGHSTLPDTQICAVDVQGRNRERLPLSQASDGVYDNAGNLYFTRFNFQGSQTKRYQGGTAQNLWVWRKDAKEATPLTVNFPGTSRSPMFWNGRVYFASDRDGVMNAWSMNPDGKDLRQHTHHDDFDVQSPSLSRGRIAYQCGADLYLLDLATGKTSKINIRLPSDFDQMRERWVKNPKEWMTSAHLSPDGTKVVITARGQVWVAPARQGRFVEATRQKLVRYREARFSGDGKSLLALSDESGETELWRLGTRGFASEKPEQLTRNATTLRWDTAPSPDGKWIARTDKAHRLHLYDQAAKSGKVLAQSTEGDFQNLTWSPDSRYLAYIEGAPTSGMAQIKLYDTQTAQTLTATSDRYSSYNPAFSPDGQFMYFLSDRAFKSAVSSPWGDRQPEPFFDKQTQIFYLALRPGLRPPFQADDELVSEADRAKADAEKAQADAEKIAREKAVAAGQTPPTAPTPPKPQPSVIAPDGLIARVGLVPVPPGNYGGLACAGKRLFFLSGQPAGQDGPPSLKTIEVKSENVRVENVLDGVATYELSQDSKKILARKDQNLYIFGSTGAGPNLEETRVTALDGWTFSFDPREEWRQMFNESWRLHRDYFYAANMHGVDWLALREKYRPLSERVTDRSELADVLAQMMSELSVLHTFVYGGDNRGGTDSVGVARLGAEWKPDAARGGWRITRLYRSDADERNWAGLWCAPALRWQSGT